VDYHKVLLEQIKRILPENYKIADMLMDTLSISRESAYRRIRNEVPFTFEEIAVLAKDYGISLDNLAGIEAEKSKPFQLKLPEFISPKNEDVFLYEDFIGFLDRISVMPDTELGIVTNEIPQYIFCGFENLTKFNIFKWQYYYHNNNIIPYHELVVPEVVKRSMHNQFEKLKCIKKSYYVFDKYIFKKVIKELEYFNCINLIKDEDVNAVKKDLNAILEYIELLTITGRFKETNNEVLIYISDMDITNSYSYIKNKEMNYSLIKTFILTSVTSFESKTFRKIWDWIQATLRTATQITCANEISRIQFLNYQRQCI